MNKKINISIVGTGLMGLQHIKAIKKSKKANLHSIVDISNNAKNLSKKYKIPLYSNVSELLNSKKLDAVIVATPNQLHEKHTVSFLKNKIPTPDYKIKDTNKINPSDIPIPSVVKPINNGSSVGVYIILSESDKTNFLNELSNWHYGKYLMIEEYIKGRELTCGIINNKPTEIMEITSNNIFYDYETKYTEGMSKYEIPNNLPSELYKRIKDFTLHCHNLLGCKGVTRTDFRLEKTEDNIYRPFVLEINTNPGLTKTSLIPKLAQKEGISYNELIKLIIQDALCQN